MRGWKGSDIRRRHPRPLLHPLARPVPAGSTVDRIAAHIDLVPTLLDACGVPKPQNVLDGKSLLPLLKGRSRNGRLARPDADVSVASRQRPQAVPVVRRAHSAVQARVRNGGPWLAAQSGFELFDMTADPYEEHDLAAKRPEEVARLKAAYSAWFDDVSRQGYEPPRIWLGSPVENPCDAHAARLAGFGFRLTTDDRTLGSRGEATRSVSGEGHARWGPSRR